MKDKITTPIHNILLSHWQTAVCVYQLTMMEYGYEFSFIE